MNHLNLPMASPRRETFMQFKVRQRGVSRRLSAQVKDVNDGEFGALIKEDDELNEAYSKSQRMSKIKYYALWGLVNLSLCIYIFGVIFVFWDAWKVDCIEQLSVWLVVYEVLQGAHLVRTIAIIIFWKKAVDPSYAQIKLELFFGAWIFLCEAGWLIYGNTFIYSSEIHDCDDDLSSILGNNLDLNTDTLRISTLVVIIYGYFLLGGIILLACFFMALYFGYKSYTAQDMATANRDGDSDTEGDPTSNNNNNISTRLIESTFRNNRNPTLLKSMQTLKNMKLTEGSSGNQSGMQRSNTSRKSFTDKVECGLCWETFVPTDEVFNCKKMHVFHTKCYEDRY